MIINNKRHSINSLAYAIGLDRMISRKAAFWFAKMAVKRSKRVAA
jgi:hypothetical protein